MPNYSKNTQTLPEITSLKEATVILNNIASGLLLRFVARGCEAFLSERLKVKRLTNSIKGSTERAEVNTKDMQDFARLLGLNTTGEAMRLIVNRHGAKNAKK